uniref:DNA-3-methyladenine glycosylase II n=2 Tax=Paenibacillus athensensis TaxID=1967502 RepID=A0A4Y8PWP7_9BACL
MHVIRIAEDYSFAQVLGYLQRSSLECLHAVTEEGRLIKAFDAGGRLLLLEIGAGVEPATLEVRLLAEGRETGPQRQAAVRGELMAVGLQERTDELAAACRCSEGGAANGDAVVSEAGATSGEVVGSEAGAASGDAVVSEAGATSGDAVVSGAGGTSGDVVVSEAGGTSGDAVGSETNATSGDATASAGIDEAVIALVREWLDADVELAPFYELGLADEVLREVVERGRGLRIVGIPDLFEALVWAIMGQQINLTFAYKLKRSFVEAFGRSLEHEGRRYWLFPTPERIAAVEPGELTAMQLSASKTQCMLTTARLMACGELNKAALAAAEPEAAVAALTAIRGIGPWTAHYVSMHCLRHRDAYPAEDAGLHNALRTRLGLPGKLPVSVVRELGERWRPWRAYAVFYLWNIH